MIPWLDPQKPPCFPDTSRALKSPNGLLAAGGRLRNDWLLAAYKRGIFPWFDATDPILWWSPEPRAVLFPERFHSSRSLTKLARQQRYRITCDQDFEAVIHHCAAARKTGTETWIVEEIILAYSAMFEAGLAHSLECRDADNQLLGGIYGIALGQVFFGESMFSLVANASKLCLRRLAQSGCYKMIDCQMTTAHLVSLGAVEVSRNTFEHALQKHSVESPDHATWESLRLQLMGSDTS